MNGEVWLGPNAVLGKQHILLVVIFIFKECFMNIICKIAKLKEA